MIGCGYIAQKVHLPLLLKMPDVEVKALADINNHRLAQAGRLFPAAKQSHDYHEVLTCDTVDCVIISAPTALHAEIAEAAIEAGKHLYLEKPLATNVNSARQVLKAWRQSNRVGMVGFNFRFNPLYQQMRDMIQNDQIGALVGARSVFSTIAQSRPDWTAALEDGGGVLLELASHDIDLTRYLFNAEIETVFAERVNDANADTVSMQLHLTNGISVQGLFSLGSVEESRYEVYGENGRLSIDRYHSWKLNHQGLHAKGLMTNVIGLLREMSAFSYGVRKLRSPENEPSYLLSLEHFVNGVRYRRPLLKPDIADGFQVMTTIAAAEASAENGSPSLVESHEKEILDAS